MNQELVKIFQEMSVLLDIKGVDFKPRAFERAAYSLEAMAEEAGEIYKHGGLKALEDIPGVGRGIAERIEEYLKTGKIREHQKLKKELPVDVADLSRLEGIGPQTIKKLYRELKIKTIEDLGKAAKLGHLRELAGLGPKSEQRILKSINFLQQSRGRFILGYILPVASKIIASLRSCPAVKRVEVAGSLARWQETVGDLDILAISSQPEKTMDFFIKLPPVQEVIIKGPTRTSVRLKIGLDADLRVISPESFGAATQYFVGDKYHNIAVREIAAKKGYKLNEYGLFKGRKKIAAEDEKEIYEKLGLSWIPPEIRTNQGEIEAAQNHQLPDLIGYHDLKGDLQVQTDWSDGENSIREMAEAAKKRGLSYIGITDHTKSLGVAGGLDEKKLKKQMAEIDKINREIGHFKVLKGSEVDIKKDGLLDLNDGALAELEVVGAAVHSHFNMSEQEMTARIIRAMENPKVDIIFHPTGRIIQKREAYRVDMPALIKAAKRTKTVLEINAYPERLDLKDEHIRQAVNAGVKLSVNSDAHAAEHFGFLELGIAQARRGWAEKKDIINTRSWENMLSFLK